MKKQFMDMIMDWSNEQCSPLDLKMLGSLSLASPEFVMNQSTDS